MMKIRDMKIQDYDIVMKMVRQFYHTEAVSHVVEKRIMENCFYEALKGNPYFRGLIIEDDNESVGYAYLTTFFATEIGGLTQMIEQLYIIEKSRGKGYGTQFLKWLEKEYSHISRWRLEVSENNSNAIVLYQKLGYSFLDYGQMFKDKE